MGQQIHSVIGRNAFVYCTMGCLKLDQEMCCHYDLGKVKFRGELCRLRRYWPIRRKVHSLFFHHSSGVEACRPRRALTPDSSKGTVIVELNDTWPLSCDVVD